MMPRRILVLAEGQLGDLLLLTPALRGMKSSFPEAVLAVLVVERRGARILDPGDPVVGPLPEHANSVLAGNRSVDQLFTLNREGLRSLSISDRIRAEYSIVRFLRGLRPDTVISAFPEDRFALWAFASGATMRVGQDDQGLRRLLTVRPGIRKGDAGVLQYYCDLVRACGASCDSTKTEYRVSDESRAWASEALPAAGVPQGERLVIVHPGASGDYKIWPPECYAQLLDQLRADHVHVILCGGPLDNRILEAIARLVQSDIPVIDTGGHLGNLGALLEKARLCIANDSGPRHLAVALGIPTLAFFRLHHDREWLAYEETDTCVVLRSGMRCPVCPPQECLDLIPEKREFGSHCIRMVSVGDAVAAARRMLT